MYFEFFTGYILLSQLTGENPLFGLMKGEANISEIPSDVEPLLNQDSTIKNYDTDRMVSLCIVTYGSTKGHITIMQAIYGEPLLLLFIRLKFIHISWGHSMDSNTLCK